MSKDVAIAPRAIPFGNYHLLERLAVGGMAEVYLAKSFGVAGSERLVALKRILPTIAEDDEFIAMFIDEAKIAGQLNHENIAQIFDLGKINSSYFIAMEYVSGHDLRALWDRARDAPDGLPLPMICSIVRRICAGLDYAHRRRDNRGRPLGIIHRDVSPQNILISYDGDLKIIDFGIAKAANRMVRTQTGILKGKFAYMAPEQARGEPTDHRADIFAIGVILYELTTGERAFKAETDFALLEKVRKVDVVPPRQLRKDLPEELERVIYRALARDADDRYAWASELEEDLAQFMKRQGYRSSKSKLGAFVRGCFEEEYEEEQRRLKVYRDFKLEEPDRRLSTEPPVPDPPSTSADDDTRIHDPSKEKRTAGRPRRRAETDDDSRSAPSSEFAASDSGASGVRATSSSVAVLGSPAVEAPLDAFGNPSEKTGYPVDEGTHVFDEDGGPGFGEPTVVDLAYGERLRASSLQEDTKVASEMPSFSSAQADVSSAAFSRHLDQDTSIADRDASDERPGPRGRQHHDENIFARRERDRPEPPPPRPAPASHAPASRASRKGLSSSLIGAGLVAGLLVGVAATFVAVGGVKGGTTSGLVLSTDPTGVRAKAGDRVLCEATPCVVDLGKPTTVVFEADQGPAERQIDPAKAEKGLIHVSLRPPKVKFLLETNPSGATVKVDGHAVPGTTPLRLPELDLGAPVRLSISKKGFVPRDSIEVAPLDPSVPWKVRLAAVATRWTVRVTPDDAVISPSEGKPSQGTANIDVDEGKVVAIRVARPDCEPQLFTLAPTGAESEIRSVRLDCRAFNGTLSVSSKSSVSVVIDGEELPGRRRRLTNFPLTAGAHLVELRSKRGRSERQVVEIAKGENTLVKTKIR